VTIAISLNNLDWFELGNSVEARYGDRARMRVDAWHRILQGDLQQDEREKLETVNRFFNLLNFVDDIHVWGEKDYWATPVEFLGANGGDCEDYSIAKYLTLLTLGVDQEKMRITYVKATSLNQFHMVLAYYSTVDAVPLILDNIDGEIKSAVQRRDLIPIYSFNGQNLWLNKEKGQGVLAGKSSRLSRWNDLNHRFRLHSMRKPIISLE
jgi:predicted transglutaminase-like cysteine proteinase